MSDLEMDPAAALRQFDEGLAPPEPEQQQIEDHGVIRVDLGFPNGKRLQGAFAYRLPTSVRDTMAIGVIATTYRGGLAPEVVSRHSALMAHRAAYVQVAVQDAPGWASDWRDVPVVVIDRLYAEVTRHELMFLDAIRDGAAPAAGDPREGATPALGGKVGASEQG